MDFTPNFQGAVDPATYSDWRQYAMPKQGVAPPSATPQQVVARIPGAVQQLGQGNFMQALGQMQTGQQPVPEAPKPEQPSQFDWSF